MSSSTSWVSKVIVKNMRDEIAGKDGVGTSWVIIKKPITGSGHTAIADDDTSTFWKPLII